MKVISTIEKSGLPGQASGGLDACFNALAGGETPLVLATVVQAIGSTSGKAGNKALVSAQGIIEGWIGGGCVQPAVVEAAGLVLKSAQACLIRVGPKGEWETLDGVVDFSSGCLSRGTEVIFIEPLNKLAKLSILGNSPVALCLSELALHLDFSVTVMSPQLEPSQLADTVNREPDFDSIGAEFVVVATQGRDDRAALTAAIESDAGYIAMVASRKKIAGLKASLAKSGVESVRLDRIHSPAGIEIGAVSPAEIALSILAQLVQLRRSSSGSPLDQADAAVVENSAAANEPAKGGCCGGG